jgi:hypothetical protein
MIGSLILNRLREILPQYTKDFSDEFTVSSLTKSGTTITATVNNHGLLTGDYISIANAKKVVNIISITTQNNIATVTVNQEHQLTDPSFLSKEWLPIKIEIANTTNYNGIFDLLTVPDAFTFTFKVNSLLPTENSGSLLIYDSKYGWNGYKQITKIDDNNISYQNTSNIGTQAVGDIKLYKGSRIQDVASIERLQAFYNNQQKKSWLFVYVDRKETEKSGSAITASNAQNRGQKFLVETLQYFSLLIIIPTKTDQYDDSFGGRTSDLARSYEIPILKSIVNYRFDSDLSQAKYQPCDYLSTEPFDYGIAYVGCRFDFVIKGYIEDRDVYDELYKATPLKQIGVGLNNITGATVNYNN